MRGKTPVRPRASQGFTLIELLVTAAILVLITSMVLLDYNRFGGSVTLENFAYDVALTVRQAQVYGIAVQRFGANTFQGYGVHFALSSPTTYIIYADTEGTGLYDPSANPSEIAETDSITQNYAITGLCAITYLGGVCTPMQTIDVFFKRPEPSSYISVSPDGSPLVSCIQNITACQSEAKITLMSPKGDTRTIVVDSTGQIFVQ